MRADRADNLFESPPGDPGAHGDYDAMAHDHSVQLMATKHRRAVLTGVAAATAALIAATVAQRG